MRLPLGPRWLRSLGRVLLGQAEPNRPSPPWGPSYLVLPAPRGGPYPPLSGCARWLLGRASQLAGATCGRPTRLLTVDRAGAVHTFPEGEKRSARSLFEDRAPLLLMNLSFLLRPQPTLPRLRRTAGEGGLALLVAPDGQSLEAVAVPRCRAGRPDLPRALARLVSTQPPSGGRSSPLGPPFLNRAVAELLHAPADTEPVDSPERLRQALLARRDSSAVPWLFNALVNGVESRTGRAVLASYPPEVHLSLTGRCNIECRFCSYKHSSAYSDFVTPGQLARLDFLRHVHTLRLSSGLGEPTLNPHLPAILDHLARTFPHLVLNFFTNGLTLRRPRLLEALVGRVAWINVSLNAASRETWQELCRRDAFDQVAEGLQALRRARGRQAQPLVYGSMVLTARNLHELPRMPGLCRRLGIVRFTAIPFFSYAFDRLPGGAVYGADESFHLCRDRYDDLFAQTVEQARRHAVSVELPLPADQKRTAFGLEVRSFYNFADLAEPPYYWLPALLDGLVPAPPAAPCHEVYDKAHVGSRQRGHLAQAATHHLYPCLGPMSMVDFSGWTGFDFPDAEGFLRLWNHPVLARLRAAQSTAGVCRVCDSCRGMDSRDPHNFGAIEGLLAEEWPAEPSLIPPEQLRLRAG